MLLFGLGDWRAALVTLACIVTQVVRCGIIWVSKNIDRSSIDCECRVDGFAMVLL
jgi:hypothetical protein